MLTFKKPFSNEEYVLFVARDMGMVYRDRGNSHHTDVVMSLARRGWLAEMPAYYFGYVLTKVGRLCLQG